MFPFYAKAIISPNVATLTHRDVLNVATLIHRDVLNYGNAL